MTKKIKKWSIPENYEFISYIATKCLKAASSLRHHSTQPQAEPQDTALPMPLVSNSLRFATVKCTTRRLQFICVTSRPLLCNFRNKA